MTPQCHRSPCKLCITSLLTPPLKCTLPILTRAAARLHHTRRQHDGDARTHARTPILCVVCAIFLLHSHVIFLSSQITLAHHEPTHTPAQTPARPPSRPRTHAAFAAEQGSVAAASHQAPARRGRTRARTHARTPTHEYGTSFFVSLFLVSCLTVTPLRHPSLMPPQRDDDGARPPTPARPPFRPPCRAHFA
jgi:hypothetical protein